MRQIPNSWWVTKEAKSIRGLPDIFGTINGKFIVLECKRSQEESEHTTGRIVLQRKVLMDIRKVGGYSAFVYPQNEKYILEDLKSFCS